MKVLIVDDDLTICALLNAFALQWGYEPIVVHDGEGVCALLQNESCPRLILLDWELPGISGVNVCEYIRAQAYEDPPYIILLTGRHDVQDLALGLEAGANDFISKPFLPIELKARMHSARRILDLQEKLNELNKKLEQLALMDELTSLLNRRAIMEKLGHQLLRAQRFQEPLSVGLCDLDYFKRINDAHGHPVGDRVLAATAQCLKLHLRPHDVVGRYGGEEFLLVMSAGREMAWNIAERLRKAVAALSVEADGQLVAVTISLGILTLRPSDLARQPEALLAMADKALYQAKADGRNCTRLIGVDGGA